MKDISHYIDFDKYEGKYEKRSIKSLINVSCIVHDWKELSSRFRDGNPAGKYVQMYVETDNVHYIVNTGSVIIMEQLDAIRPGMEQEGEHGFTCIIKRVGGGIKMFPLDLENKDVSPQKQKEEK